MLLIKTGLFLLALWLAGCATPHRSRVAIADFKRDQHCPSTGLPRGPCPGYIIDHVIPLACGGADSPDNMQWQTTEAAKAKDKWERVGCQ